MENIYDLVVIGDTVVDEFIKLENAEILGEPDTPSYKIAIPFGEKVPYTEAFAIAAVGNAANAAISAARLGLKTAIVTNLGDDKEGEDCLATFRKDGVSLQFIKINPGMQTNHHYVLWYGAERTILIKHEGYPYTIPEIGDPKWIYFSSASEKAFPFHNEIADYLDAHPDIKLAFQPGKNEIKLGKEKLERLYQKADLFVCNVEEAEKILGTENADPKELLKKMCELGPKTVVITDGPKGSYAYDGTDCLFMPIYPDPQPPYSRIGAGDAFASTMTAAIILGKTLPEALSWASINSMAVVQKVGANVGLLTRPQLEQYLKTAPTDYQAKKLD